VDAQRIVLFSSCLPGWDAPRVIDAALALGFPAVEWGIGPGQAIERPQDAAELRRRCDRAGLRVAGLSVQDRAVTLGTPRRAARHVQAAITLGAPHLRLFAPAYQGGSLDRQQARARAGLHALLDLAAPAGLAVLVETSPTTLAPSPDLALALVEGHSPERAGVLYDPGNMAIEGHLAPRLALARLGRHVRHLHVKNIAWTRRDGVWQWRHAPLAEGLLDWREILVALEAARYQGAFSIDHLGGKATLALLRAESGRLRELLSSASSSRADRERAAKSGGADGGS
jgi:sugar phosphate isomerase/epimerase